MDYKFADFIEKLPKADIPFQGVDTRLIQGGDHQVVFFRIPAGASVPPHSHAAQWGLVVSGRIEITIGGATRQCGPGDAYDIGKDEIHEVKCLEDTVAIDFFDDPARYRIRA